MSLRKREIVGVGRKREGWREEGKNGRKEERDGKRGRDRGREKGRERERQRKGEREKLWIGPLADDDNLKCSHLCLTLLGKLSAACQKQVTGGCGILVYKIHKTALKCTRTIKQTRVHADPCLN